MDGEGKRVGESEGALQMNEIIIVVCIILIPILFTGGLDDE